MRVLGIDTSSADGSVAVVERVDGGAVTVLAEFRARVSNAHGESLLPWIDDVLRAAGCTLKDIDRLAVGIGPGSFTGTRIGVATAKGLALGAGMPLVGIDAFRALAAEAPAAGPVVVAIDARKGEVYVALVDGAEVGPPAHLSPLQTFAHVAPALAGRSFVAVGDGVGLVAELAGLPQPFVESPRAVTVARLALEVSGDQLVDLEPLYVRPPDITVPASALKTITISST
ncbi:MAG: tRNA (adenosine(37)-N6)-threonylcarbamoyltransferase complex dimerization subunit type 1 TsaB [Myxococcales bacterium]|nr:tRNA (adenosine(37)-N6)-threonylcarbamoyltransferase complex dimerization subunit type 1 TsaB [Myxococcales bacterium]